MEPLTRLSTHVLAVRHVQRLRAELVRLLYASSSIALITTPLASITLAIIGWTRAPAALVLAWLGYVLAVAVTRALMVQRFRRLPPDAVDVTTWSRRFVVGVAAAGLGWGMAALLFFSTSTPWQMFLALVLAGVAMAAVPVLVTSRLSLVESARALIRLRQQGRVAESRLADARREVDALWTRYELWELTPAVCDLACHVVPDRALRTLDALHLATFLVARRRIEGLELLTADERLEDAARSL